jgi:hypothetical protein
MIFVYASEMFLKETNPFEYSWNIFSRYFFCYSSNGCSIEKIRKRWNQRERKKKKRRKTITMKSSFDSIGGENSSIEYKKNCGQTDKERKKECNVIRKINDSIIVITFLIQ